MSVCKNILIVDRFSHEALLTLQSQSFLCLQQEDSFQLGQRDLSQINGLIIRSRTQITEEIFARAKNLQVVITATSGFDHIDLTAARKWGVTVMYTPEANVESAAQLTWALVLSCANKIRQAQVAVQTNEWNRDLLIGTELQGKSYGVVGLGRIGSRVADFANTFGMNVLAHDPYVENSAFRAAEAERVSFDEILKRADVLSFHVPATEETRHMINRSRLDFINRGLILINSSRGSVFYEEDLCHALDQGWLGALGLDVYEKEPLSKNSKLLQYPNVVLTPHIGANTTEAFQKAGEHAALQLIRFFVDGSTKNTLPPQAPWYGARPPFKD